MFAEIRPLAYALWDRRWVGLAVAWIVAILGSVVVYSMHDRFQASAKVFVDTQTVLKPLMAGLAVQPDVDQQVNMVARTLISRPNIEILMQNPGIVKPDTSSTVREQILNKLLRDIKLTGGGRDNLYSITYRDPDPRRAELVVKSLVNLFVESGLVNGREGSREARRFIDQQIAQYEAKLSESEERLKEFKMKHLGFSPNQNNTDYYGRVGQMTEEEVQIKGQLRAAEMSRDAIKRELNGEQPMLIPDGGIGSGGAHMTDTDVRLDALHRQLDDLLRRYTDQHPDVVETRRLIAQLEQQRKTELAAMAKGQADANGMKYSTATNPVFQKLRISLAEAEANVASLQGRLDDVESRLKDLKSAAGQLPEVEAEYAQLNRDYDIIRKNYEQLVSRRESASMSESVDETSQMANFKVIDPPYVAPHPVFPSRLMLIIGLLFGSLAAGVLAAFGLNEMFPTVRTIKALRDLTGRPVLGGISMLGTGQVLKVERRLNYAFFSGIGGLVFINLAWFVWTMLRMSTN